MGKDYDIYIGHTKVGTAYLSDASTVDQNIRESAAADRERERNEKFHKHLEELLERKELRCEMDFSDRLHLDCLDRKITSHENIIEKFKTIITICKYCFRIFGIIALFTLAPNLPYLTDCLFGDLTFNIHDMRYTLTSNVLILLTIISLGLRILFKIINICIKISLFFAECSRDQHISNFKNKKREETKNE